MSSIGRMQKLGMIVLLNILGYQAAFADPNATWQVEPSMAVARDQFTGGVIGQYLYVFGGNGNPDGMDLKSTEAFNVDSGVWSFRVDNEHNSNGWGLEELTGAVVNDKLYVFGAASGIAPDGYNGVCNFNEMYDPATNTWTTLAQKPTTSTAGPAVVYNGEIYIFGGYFDSENPAQEHERYRVVECYNPADNVWRSVTDMPSAISNPAVAVVGSKAYIIGGYSHSLSSMVSDVASFDFETGQWQTEGYTPLPAALAFTYSGAAPVVDGKIYVIGGIAGDPEDNWGVDTVYIFDPVANTWEDGPALPEPRENHVGLLHNERIYVVGGYIDEDDENRALTSVLSLDVSSVSDVNEHVFKIEMSKTYDYRWYSGSAYAFSFDAAVQADDGVSSIVMRTPGGSEFSLDLEVEDGERWFNHHVSSLNEADLGVYTTGTYTFTVHYAAGGSDTTTVLYAQPGGEAIPPVTQQPILLSPSDGATGISPSVTFTFETPTDPDWTIGLEWEAVADANDAGEADVPGDANSYGPVALSPDTEYEVVMTIDHAVWGTNADGIPTVVDTDAEERFTFTTGAAVLRHDWNGDGIVSIVGDVPPFVQCVYFNTCPDDMDTIAVGDCNHDGILSIVGDVPCFVECVYFNNCPE
ncbi:MAG: hypothetical protein ABFE13_25430 [Phycisphaerales bacterium]